MAQNLRNTYSVVGGARKDLNSDQRGRQQRYLSADRVVINQEDEQLSQNIDDQQQTRLAGTQVKSKPCENLANHQPCSNPANTSNALCSITSDKGIVEELPRPEKQHQCATACISRTTDNSIEKQSSPKTDHPQQRSAADKQVHDQLRSKKQQQCSFFEADSNTVINAEENSTTEGLQFCSKSSRGETTVNRADLIQPEKQQGLSSDCDVMIEDHPFQKTSIVGKQMQYQLCAEKQQNCCISKDDTSVQKDMYSEREGPQLYRIAPSESSAFNQEDLTFLQGHQQRLSPDCDIIADNQPEEHSVLEPSNTDRRLPCQPCSDNQHQREITVVNKTDKEQSVPNKQQQCAVYNENNEADNHIEINVPKETQQRKLPVDVNIGIANDKEQCQRVSGKHFSKTDERNTEVAAAKEQDKAIDNLKRLKLCIVKLRAEDIPSWKGKSTSKSLRNNSTTKNDSFTNSGKNAQTNVKNLGKRDKSCKYCGKFYHGIRLREHIWQAHSTFEPYQCQKCKKRFKIKWHLNKHQRLCFTKKEAKIRLPAPTLYNRYTCYRCDESFNKKTKHRQHEKKCKERFSCTFCHKKFKSLQTRSIHEKTHRNDPKPFHCNFCIKKFGTRYERAWHEKTHTGPVKCRTCGLVCGNESRYRLHVKKKHVNDPDLVCSYCGKLYNRHKISKHEKTHLIERKGSVCQECSKVFKRRDQLVRHVKELHGEKKFSCRHCTYRTTLMSLLTKHVSSVHEKPFKCTSCDKNFGTKIELERHQGTHTTVRAYSCSYCNVCFKTKSSRYQHEQSHLDKRKHACSFCDKKFRLKHHLKQHERVHTNERPFVCEVCGAAFKVLHHLFQHNATHPAAADLGGKRGASSHNKISRGKGETKRGKKKMEKER